MAVIESDSPSDMGVPTIEVPPVQFRCHHGLCSPKSHYSVRSVPILIATNDTNTESSTGISAVVPVIQVPDYTPEKNFATRTTTRMDRG